MPRENNRTLNGWEEILFTYDDVEAEIVKDLLEAQSIQVAVQSMKITPYPVSIGRMGEIRLLVRSEDSGAAREVLAAMKENEEKED